MGAVLRVCTSHPNTEKTNPGFSVNGQKLLPSGTELKIAIYRFCTELRSRVLYADLIVSYASKIAIYSFVRDFQQASRLGKLPDSMPTLLTWIYSGGKDGSPEARFRGVQRLHPGDRGIDDVLDEVTVVRMDGEDLVVEYESDGELKTVPRTAGHIRAKNSLPAKALPDKAGRPGQRTDIFNFLGAAGAAASPGVQKPKAKGKAAKGLGKTVPAPKPAAAPASGAKRKEPTNAGAGVTTTDAGKEGEGAVGDGNATDALAQLGAQYAESSDEEMLATDGNPVEAKPAKSGSVSFRKMDDEQKRDYRKEKYQKRKDDLQVRPRPCPSTTLLSSRHTHSLTHERCCRLCCRTR